MITEKDIKKLLVDLNKKKAGGYIITRPLSDIVQYAKVWQDIPNQETGKLPLDETPTTYYLIHGKEGKYMAAVLLYDNDLKWFMLPEYRKSSLLVNTLRETILPHILQHKPLQRMTLHQPEYSVQEFGWIKKTALAAGFKITKEENGNLRLTVTADIFQKREYISGVNTSVPETRIIEIKNELSLMIQKLTIFETELKLKVGHLDYAEDVLEIIYRLKELRNRDLRLISQT